MTAWGKHLESDLAILALDRVALTHRRKGVARAYGATPASRHARRRCSDRMIGTNDWSGKASLQVPVVGIIGSGRSGSTLLEYLLAAAIPDARALGELHSIVARTQRNELCSCGRQASDCPRWAGVISLLAVHSSRECWRLAVEDRRHHVRWAAAAYAGAVGHRLAGQRPTGLRRRIGGRLTRLADGGGCYLPVLDVLSEVSRGHGAVIDNSKTPSHFFALAAAGHPDLRMVHIVRTPQAVAWSWKRRKHLPESGSLNWFMEPRPAVWSGAVWLYETMLAASFQWLYPAVPYVRVSYEELCAHPEPTLARCAAALGLRAAAVTGPPADYHVLGGNPARFDGFRHVELDDEWRACLGWPARVAFGIALSPLYRLLLRNTRAGHPSPGGWDKANGT